MGDWDADFSPCNFATTHFHAEKAVISPCSFATAHQTACILNVYIPETSQPMKWTTLLQRPISESSTGVENSREGKHIVRTPPPKTVLDPPPHVCFGNGPNTVSESTVSNTELSEFFGPHRVPVGGNSVSSSQPIFACQSELTEIFAELTEFAIKLSEAQ